MTFSDFGELLPLHPFATSFTLNSRLTFCHHKILSLGPQGREVIIMEDY